MAQQIKKKYLSSEVISYFDDQINAVEVSVTAEETARIAGDAQTLSDSQDYVDSEVQSVVTQLQGEIASGDTATLSSANSYTDAQIVSAQGDIAAAEAAIAQEILDRQAADTNLQNQINSVLSNVDPGALDSLTEIVTAFQAADSSLNGAITALSTSLAADIASEEAARIAADSALQGEIDAEEVARAAADVTLQNNINSEESARIAADNALDARLDVLEAVVWFKEKFSIVNGQTSVTLSFTPKSGSVSAFVDRLAIHEGASEDYTISGTTVTFLNDLVSPGNSSLGNGDTVYFKYQK